MNWKRIAAWLRQGFSPIKPCSHGAHRRDERKSQSSFFSPPSYSHTPFFTETILLPFCTPFRSLETDFAGIFQSIYWKVGNFFPLSRGSQGGGSTYTIDVHVLPAEEREVVFFSNVGFNLATASAALSNKSPLLLLLLLLRRLPYPFCSCDFTLTHTSHTSGSDCCLQRNNQHMHIVHILGGSCWLAVVVRAPLRQQISFYRSGQRRQRGGCY